MDLFQKHFFLLNLVSYIFSFLSERKELAHLADHLVHFVLLPDHSPALVVPTVPSLVLIRFDLNHLHLLHPARLLEHLALTHFDLLPGLRFLVLVAIDFPPLDELLSLVLFLQSLLLLLPPSSLLPLHLLLLSFPPLLPPLLSFPPLLFSSPPLLSPLLSFPPLLFSSPPLPSLLLSFSPPLLSLLLSFPPLLFLLFFSFYVASSSLYLYPKNNYIVV